MAVSVVLSPAQYSKMPVIERLGLGFSVTSTFAVLVQLLESVRVTVYVPAVTVIEDVVAAFDHR